MYIKFIAVVLAAGVLLCSGCSQKNGEEPTVLQDLVYQPGVEESDCTIYLCEESGFVPYLVLTDAYADDKACLLLRCDLLEETGIYQENHRYSGYYADSTVDRYLNACFYETLSDCLQRYLQLVPVEITCKSSLWGGEGKTEYIERYIFLLSVYEISGRSSTTQLKEGKPLGYFDSDQRRTAFSKSAEACSWWLRTPNIWYDNIVYAVNPQGAIDVGGTGQSGRASKSGIRPAFCLPSQMKIVCLQGQYYLYDDAPTEGRTEGGAP